MNVYGLFYKNHYGHEELIERDGQFFIFSSANIANLKAKEYVDYINDKLSPRIVFVRKSFFKKEMIEKKPILPEFERKLYEQQLKTIFVKIVKII